MGFPAAPPDDPGWNSTFGPVVAPGEAAIVDPGAMGVGDSVSSEEERIATRSGWNKAHEVRARPSAVAEARNRNLRD